MGDCEKRQRMMHDWKTLWIQEGKNRQHISSQNSTEESATTQIEIILID